MDSSYLQRIYCTFIMPFLIVLSYRIDRYQSIQFSENDKYEDESRTLTWVLPRKYHSVRSYVAIMSD